MLFSIVVPVYNVEKYLNECLQSIICQVNRKENDCEILLIDDGSTDRSGEICDKYSSEYPDLIRVYHNSNHGLLLTRRYGYEHASGEYIRSCDSDDLLEKNMLEDIKKVIQKYHEPDMILFNYYTVLNDMKKNGYSDIFTTKPDCWINREELLEEFMLHHSVVSVCTKVYKRSCVDLKMNYIDFSRVNNGEDTLQSIEFFNNAKTFVYLNKELYDYRIGSGMTRKFDYDYYFGFKKVLEYLEAQSMIWKIPKFNHFFAIKVLQTAGRAITQSRYKNWASMDEHKTYLKQIAEDEMLQENIHMLGHVKNNLHTKYSILLKMLSLKMFFCIIVMLRLKNIVEKEKTKNESKQI